MSRRQRALLGRTLLFLFALNALSVSLYFLLNPHPSSPSQTLTSTESQSQSQTIAQTLKPWPSLPSFLPWIPNPNPPLRSCEAYFGNGLSNLVDVLGSGSESGSGWLRCHHSETLASSVCEMGRVRMIPDRIRMSHGGEPLESVIGRGEEEELPKFEVGSFEIEGDGGEVASDDQKVVDREFLDRYLPQGQVHSHTMRALLDSVRIVGREKFECLEWIEEPTLLVTRFEYANLFHTVTDWYSAYVSSRVTNLPSRPHLIFVDGHCKAPLEETWEALFSSVRYAKNFSGPVCLRHAVMSPLGYETALFKGLTETINCQGTLANIIQENPDDRKTARLSEFGEMLRAAFNLLTDEKSWAKPSMSHNVLFVRREDYLAHPRHNGRVESRLSNEQEVFDAIKVWADKQTKCKINMVNGLFAHMPMKEQLRAIQESSVIIGAHGAGLTHMVAATPDTIVLEIISSFYRRPHFSLISRWKGLEYHAINLSGSYARPSMVIDELSSIMRSLKC